ncbi:MAG: hypothetical protein IKF91_01825 [Bacilli bacterium]|nr:hypothetical protein [Bacilli bacterium]
MRLTKKEELNIYGGSVSSTMVNAIVKGISLLIELGRSLGSTIRRVSENKTCSYQ